jgi:hypothetical protein
MLEALFAARAPRAATTLLRKMMNSRPLMGFPLRREINNPTTWLDEVRCALQQIWLPDFRNGSTPVI